MYIKSNKFTSGNPYPDSNYFILVFDYHKTKEF